MKLTSLIAVAAFATGAFAQEQPRLGLQLGLGVFYPNSAYVRSTFGDSWTRISIAPGTMGAYKGSGLDWDINAISVGRNGNRLFIISPSVGFYKTFGNSPSNVPYFAARLGGAYVDYRVGLGDDKYFTTSANAEIGTTINNRINLNVRYDFFPKRNGLDFSGLSLNARFVLVNF
ncbi:MAG: hypothetical protein J0L72_00070 [Armatimonadetes bacterium]|nr:hypothetical protein [Armatimonadota bacterium]